MADIRKTLADLGDAIEAIANRPAPKAQINNRELSGDKIDGGKITNFSSTGIADEAREKILTITNNGISVKAISTLAITNPLSVRGDLTVEGEVYARKLHVDEISADVRNERTSPLEFKGDNGVAYGSGLLWTGGSYTKQFILQANNDRLWSTEDIDLQKDKEYKINNQTVISSSSLGSSIFNSNLRRVGTLEQLTVGGDVSIDDFVKYDANTQRLSLGTDQPNGMLTMEENGHQFVIDSNDNRSWKIGTWTTSGLSIVTDDTARVSISSNGSVLVHNKASFLSKVGIGAKNFAEDVDLTVAGPVRLQNKKFEVADNVPVSGNYSKGDVVWNSNPRAGGHVGWVCVREGTPGEWKPFGPIAS